VEIKLEIGKKVTRQEVIQTLVVEGGISFTNVEKVEDITDETLLSACVQVIDMLAEQKDKLLFDLQAEVELTKQFYKAAQRACIRVTRDESNKIKLEHVPC
jgi:hypothetical protein